MKTKKITLIAALCIAKLGICQIYTPSGVVNGPSGSTTNVGIGTGASVIPNAKLEILSTTNQFRLSNTSTIFNDINTNASGYLTVMPSNASSSRIGFNTNLPSAGFHSNMGIFLISDPTNSTRSFQILPSRTANGDIPAGTTLVANNSTAGEGLSIAAGGTGAAGVKLGAYAYNGSWRSMWETSNTGSFGSMPNLLLVKNGGNVIIGTLKMTGTHSDAKLSVDGKIVAKSCYITMTGWADYVFANDYKVPNLYEVEAYYKANKHLPEIPSEKEIIENGVNVADMNKLLLKKIEEMTILMVQQQKDIDALKTKIK